MDGIVMAETPAKLGRGMRAETWALVGIALVVAVIHVLTNGRYGFHRDELQFLSDARHLDWGFVAYPPFTPFVERIGLEMFGVSMVGLRMFSVIAQAVAIVVTGLMALGAWRWAAGADDGGAGGGYIGTAGVRGDGVSIHLIRLSVVGADCLLRDSAAEVGESAMVDADWSYDRHGIDDEVYDLLLHRGDSWWDAAESGATILSDGGSGVGLRWLC